MKATITIDKSFDESKVFTKELDKGDFEAFFWDEGMYLDKLVNIAQSNGENGDGFTVAYTVTVTK